MSKVKPIEFIKALTAKDSPPPCLLLLAKDQIRMTRTLEQIFKNFQLVDLKNPTRNKKTISVKAASEKALKNFLFETTELSLFSKQTIYHLKEIDNVSKSKSELILQTLEDQLKSTSGNSLIVLTGEKLAKNTRLYKFFQKNKFLLEFQDFTTAESLRWIKRELQQRNISADRQVIEQIQHLAQEDLPNSNESRTSVDQALQLIDIAELYADGKALTTEMLENLFPDAFHANAYKWIDQMQQSNYVLAEKELNKLLKSNNNVRALLGLLIYNYRQLCIIKKLADNKYDLQSIAKHAKMNPWVVKKTLPVAKAIKWNDCFRFIAEILNADLKLKSKNFGEEDVLLELNYELSH